MAPFNRGRCRGTWASADVSDTIRGAERSDSKMEVKEYCIRVGSDTLHQVLKPFSASPLERGEHIIRT